MAGPLKTTRTGDADLNNAVRDVKDFADQLENPRQGVIAYPAKVISQRAQLRDEAVVVYRGPATTLQLPPATQRGRGTGQALFILNEGSGALTIIPTSAPQAGGTVDVLVGGNVTLPVNNWAVFESDGYQKWFALTNITPASVTSIKANAGGTPQSGALELDGAGSVTVTNAGGVFTITGTTFTLPNVGPGAGIYGPWVTAVTLDAQGRVTAVATATPVTACKANAGGTNLTGVVEFDGLGDCTTDSVANVIRVNGARSGSYQNYANIAGTTLGQLFYVAGCASCTTTTSRTSTANTAVGVMFVAPVRGGTVDLIDFEVTSAVAATNGRIAIYDNLADSNLWPGTLRVDSGNLSTATTGLKQAGVSVALTAGKPYWLVVNFSAASIIHRALVDAQVIPYLGSVAGGGGGFNVAITVGMAFGAFPGTFPTAGGTVITTGSSLAPLLRYRMS